MESRLKQLQIPPVRIPLQNQEYHAPGQPFHWNRMDWRSTTIRGSTWVVTAIKNYYWQLFNTQARSPCVATAYVRLQFLISRAPCYINKPPPRPCILYTPLDTSYTHMYVVPAAGSLFQRVRDNSAVNVTYDNDDGLLCDHTCYIQM